MMIDNVRTVLMDWPTDIHSFVVKKDDYYTVVLNAKESRDRQLKAYQHELEHIRRGDYDRACDADLIEIGAHVDG